MLLGGGYYPPYLTGEIYLTKTGYAMWYLWVLMVYQIITPWLLKRLGLKKLIICSAIVAIMCGFKNIPTQYFDFPRMVSFYPFFLIGIYLRRYKMEYIYKRSVQTRNSWLCLLIALLAFYVFITIFVPGFPYQTGFLSTHGLSIKGFISRHLTYTLNILICFSVIMLVPQRKTWISILGTRTMNAYLLHMSIIFPLCWGMATNFSYAYKLLTCVLITPCICLFLFSRPVDIVMTPILNVLRLKWLDKK